VAKRNNFSALLIIRKLQTHIGCIQTHKHLFRI